MVLAIVVLVVGLLLFAVPGVGPVLGIAFWVGAVWLVVRSVKAANARKAAEIAEQTTPVALPGTPVELSSRGRQKIVGEQYRPHAIRAVMGGRPPGRAGQWDTVPRTRAYLVTEPDNAHDPNAVATYLAVPGGAVLVGYLPREIAAEYKPVLRALESRHQLPACEAGVVQGKDHPQVFLYVGAAQECVFQNDQPHATRLPAERSCALSGEAQHQEVLARFNSGNGLVWATLHPSVVERGKYAGQQTMAVRIDGHEVGTLTAAQGERYSQVLTLGRLVTAEAQVYEGSRVLEARVFLPKVD